MRFQCLLKIMLALTILPFAPSPMAFACGWWGDGEMNKGAHEDPFFVPRGQANLDPDEMAKLSRTYRTGNGVVQDKAQAMLWARRAAGAGHAGAMNDLGYMYEIGTDGEINEEAAVFWFRKSAGLGLATAQHSLASMLRSGRGVEIDIEGANAWLRRSAHQGHPSAAAELATLIARDEIEPGFNAEACYWWLIGIDAGLDAENLRCFELVPNLSESHFNELVETTSVVNLAE